MKNVSNPYVINSNAFNCTTGIISAYAVMTLQPCHYLLCGNLALKLRHFRRRLFDGTCSVDLLQLALMGRSQCR